MATKKEKTRYSSAELAEFKELIQTKLKDAREQMDEYRRQIRRAEEGEGDFDYKYNGLEDGTFTAEKEYLNQMASRQVTFINHLEKALVRIENGTYGICRKTGKLISKQRLKAVPHATLSIDAKNAEKR